MDATNATVVRAEKLAGCLFRLVVRPDAAPAAWRPGQFVRLSVPGPGDDPKKDARAFSFAGADGDAFEFYGVAVPDGRTSPKLGALQAGDRLWFEPKVQGFFTLDDAPAGQTDLWMVGSGAGIAPFASMVQQGAADKFERAVVVHQVRHPDHLSYGARFAAWARSGPGRAYVPVVSAPPARFVVRDGHAALFGHVGEQLDDIAKIVGRPIAAGRTLAMLCGNPDMIAEVRGHLEARGLVLHKKRTPGQVLTERYW